MVLKYNKTGLKKLRQKKDNPSYNLIFLSALCPMLVTHSCQHTPFTLHGEESNQARSAVGMPYTIIDHYSTTTRGSCKTNILA